MTCNLNSTKCDCPFAFTEASEYVQNLGCLPTPMDIVSMRVHNGKTWACHDEPSKPCMGGINFLRKNELPHKVIDHTLVTEDDPWNQYIDDHKAYELAKDMMCNG